MKRVLSHAPEREKCCRQRWAQIICLYNELTSSEHSAAILNRCCCGFLQRQLNDAVKAYPCYHLPFFLPTLVKFTCSSFWKMSILSVLDLSSMSLPQANNRVLFCSYPLEEHIDAFSNIISRCLSKLLQESVLGTKNAMYSSSFFCLESLINLKYMFLDCKGH